ncbi:MFS transporter [Anaeromicropila populeti]|uniref:Major Facilitator Superfamily protein n=1 Tax=Anaeromicropila populeti TaxID=37658 RepID=A0A1I6LGN9_9FIRM|nr:MFS transporter [Anaeromicropila populeti]SFS02582.1 Major Facilitator Superfamily protein [Anaeromicropila populeti]
MENEKNKSFHKFLIIWLGELISCIGTGLTAFGLQNYVFHNMQTATSVSLVVLCSFLPTVLLSPVGGVLADRFDRRLMMILGDLLSASGLIFILILILDGEIHLWQICIGVTISAVFAALMEPAYRATVTDLLTEDQYSKASGLVQLASSAKYLVSPVIAGFIMHAFNIKVILCIDILTCATTVLATLFVKNNLETVKKNVQKQSFIKELKEGWSAVRESQGVFILIILISVVTFYTGFIQTLFTPMILSFSNSKTLGIVESVGAIGMLISSLLIGMFTITKKYSRELVLGIGAMGVFVILLGLKPDIYFIIGAAFLLFASLPFINSATEVLIRKSIANEKQGRVWGMVGIISQLGYICAYAIAGILADHVFNPLLMEGGALVSSFGKVFGTGEGRGIGLLISVSGVLLIVMGVVISKVKSIKQLEGN